MEEKSTNGPALEARELVKDYDGFRAVDGLTFSVRRGECYGILGPNGAGKTTTVRMIYGYMKPTAGSLRVLGIDVVEDRRAVAARVGVCQQENNLDPDLTIMENLLIFASYFDIPRKVAQKRAEELLYFIALEKRANDRVPSLSGGMMRRLVMARSLINNPDLLILDEPTTGLDPQSRHQIWDRLRDLKARGITILLTTHYMDEAERICDRLVIVDSGKVLVEGAPRDLILKHAGKQVIEVAEPDGALREFVRDEKLMADDLGHRMIIYGSDGDSAFHKIVENYCTGGCSLRLSTLEDVFLRLTGRELRD
jgi:lipooligosaccharide transport system ATP-binding protein